MAWDETAGVDALDDLLVAHFAAEFKAAQGAAGDIAAAPRALAKLRKEVLEFLSGCQPLQYGSIAFGCSECTEDITGKTQREETYEAHGRGT